ncbi:MAG: sulfotransferase domain-containing protein [Nitrospinae bacterium]|nr:sulfotransferase domain-containing protein [Nitrospinota bacterium]
MKVQPALKRFILKSRIGRKIVNLLKHRIGRKIANLYRHYHTDCYVISYPKCGRTWLRVMLAKALALYFGDPRDIVFDPIDVIRNNYQRGPLIRFTHDGIFKSPAIVTKPGEKRYQQYTRKKVVFLVRDPRDVLVSNYFQRARRRNESYDLGYFVRHQWWGIDRVVAFMKGWYEHRHVPSDFLLVRYEDLHRNPAGELHRILTFVDLEDVSDEIVRTSVDYASFDNMLKMSLNELSEEPRLAPADPQDPESFKMRRGEIGGYKRYLSAADVEYVEERIRRELPLSFGYTHSGS